MKQGRKGNKIMITVAFWVFMMSMAACNVAGAEPAAETETPKQETTKAPEQESEGPDPSKEEVPTPKKERLNRLDFEELSKAEEQVGFSFYKTKDLSNGYSFKEFSVVQTKKDDIIYNKVNVVYKGGNHISNFILSIYPKEIDTTEPEVIVSEKEIEGKQVTLAEYTIKLVEVGYEKTEEDIKRIAKGNFDLSIDGVTIGEACFRWMMWEEEGILYEVRTEVENTPVEELEAVVIGIMNSEK